MEGDELVAQLVKKQTNKQKTLQCRRYKRRGFDHWVRKIPLEKEMATHSSILAWRIPWTKEPGGARVYKIAKSRTRLSAHAGMQGWTKKKIPGLPGLVNCRQRARSGAS